MRIHHHRLLVCIPSGAPDALLLTEAARLADRLRPRALEIVATPVDALHDLRGAFESLTERGGVDAVHLAPTRRETERLAVELSDNSTLVITSGTPRWWRPRSSNASRLVVRAPLTGEAVIALVDPARDTTAPVVTAIEFAERLGLSRAVACHLFVEDGTLTSERWERRVHDEQAERLDILLARVPASETVTLTPSVVMSHVPERTISRIVKEVGAALVIGASNLAGDANLLTLPEVAVRQPRPPSGLRAVWCAFLDSPDSRSFEPAVPGLLA